MKNRTSNRLSMLHATLSHLKDHAAVTATVPALGAAITTVENKLSALSQPSQIVQADITGVTANTTRLRSAMTDLAVKCSNALSAYADSIKNYDLREKITFTTRALNKKKKVEVVSICQSIHNEAQTNLPVASAFGYSNADVAALQSAIDDYRASSSNPRLALVSKSNAVAVTDAVVRQVIDLFKNQIDRMVNTLKADHPAFVRQYYLLRQIVDLCHTFTKIRGTVTDENDVPLTGVKLTIREARAQKVVDEAISQAEGKFRIPRVTPGDYDFSWTLPGYKPIIETNVHISPGKEVRRKLTMLKV